MATTRAPHPKAPRTTPRVGRVERGIFACRDSSGNLYYRIDFRDQYGHRVRERVPLNTVTDARRLLERRRVAVRAGTYERPEDRKRREEEAKRVAAEELGPTFAKFGERFLRDHGSLRRSDYYEITIRVLGRYFGSKRLREITPEDLDLYRRHCLTVERRSPATTRKRLTTLGTMFRWAKRWGVIRENPATDLEKPPEPHHKTRFLTREEFALLVERAEPWLRPILTVAVLTGLRLKEVVGIRVESIDWDNRLVHVSEDCKTARPRAVPMTDTVLEILREQAGRFRKTGFVFLDGEHCDRTSRRERNRISQRTKIAAKAAALDGVTFHTLRHTAGSWMAQDGYSEVLIAEVLGHATTATTKRYMHLRPQHLRAPIDALEARFRGRSPVGGPGGLDTKRTPEPGAARAATSPSDASCAPVGTSGG